MKKNKSKKYLIWPIVVLSIICVINFNKIYFQNEIITYPKETMVEATKTAATGWTATFDKNGAKSISKKKLSCTSKDSCKITLPTITRNGYTILGWSTDANATKARFKVGQKVTLSKNVKLYAITVKNSSKI